MRGVYGVVGMISGLHRLVHVLSAGPARTAEGDLADMAGDGIGVQVFQPRPG